MKICGITAEYNPFHKGHAYQIEKARQAGATHILVVMSGNFVQRGRAGYDGQVGACSGRFKRRCGFGGGASAALCHCFS